MEEEIANAELVLLLLIAERPGINGYGIRRLSEERGLAAWAGVASSSIYNGLKRIERRGLATSAPDHHKRDRGPRGQAFRLTPAGLAALRAAVAELVTDIRTSVDFYTTGDGHRTVRAYVVGGGASTLGLPQILSGVLRVPVTSVTGQFLNPAKALSVRGRELASSTSATSAVGLALGAAA